MLTTITSKFGAAGLVLLTLSVGCNRTETDSGVAPDEACRVQTQTYTKADQKSLTTYTHDAGRLVSTVESETTSTGVSTYRNDYQYNTEGLLTGQLNTFKDAKGELKRTYTYQYENGRLVKRTFTSNATTSVSTYTYDAAGALVSYNTSSASYSFTNGVLTGGETRSGAKTYPVTVVNGRLTREYLDALGQYVVRDYNAAGQVVKLYFTDEKGTPIPTTHTLTYEYATQAFKTPDAPAFKGHPTVALYGADGFVSRTILTAPKGFESRSYTTDIQYKANSKGYLTERTLTTTNSAGTEQAKFVYTYANCQ